MKSRRRWCDPSLRGQFEHDIHHAEGWQRGNAPGCYPRAAPGSGGAQVRILPLPPAKERKHAERPGSGRSHTPSLAGSTPASATTSTSSSSQDPGLSPRRRGCDSRRGCQLEADGSGAERRSDMPEVGGAIPSPPTNERRVAQRAEQPLHKRKVGGAKPSTPTRPP